MERVDKAGTRSGQKQGTKNELRDRKQLKVTLWVEEQKGLYCWRSHERRKVGRDKGWAWPDCGSCLHYLNCRTGPSKKAPLFACFMQGIFCQHSTWLFLEEATLRAYQNITNILFPIKHRLPTSFKPQLFRNKILLHGNTSKRKQQQQKRSLRQ